MNRQFGGESDNLLDAFIKKIVIKERQKGFDDAVSEIEDTLKTLRQHWPAENIAVLNKIEAELEYNKVKARQKFCLEPVRLASHIYFTSPYFHIQPPLGTPERDRMHIMELVERTQASLAYDAGLVEFPAPFDRGSKTWRLAINGTTNEERVKSAHLLLKDCQKPATRRLIDESLALLVEMPTNAVLTRGKEIQVR